MSAFTVRAMPPDTRVPAVPTTPGLRSGSLCQELHLGLPRCRASSVRVRSTWWGVGLHCLRSQSGDRVSYSAWYSCNTKAQTMSPRKTTGSRFHRLGSGGRWQVLRLQENAEGRKGGWGRRGRGSGLAFLRCWGLKPGPCTHLTHALPSGAPRRTQALSRHRTPVHF